MIKLTTILFCLLLAGAGYTDRYTDNFDGTITDTATGLMWLKDAGAVGQMDWATAVAFCDNLVTNGYSDWRLPTVDQEGDMSELDTLGRAGGDPNGAWEGIGLPFQHVQATNYWSGSIYHLNSDPAYLVNMATGEVTLDWKYNAHYVWPVRGMQAPLKATNPIPADVAINQPTNTAISWRDGGYAQGYIVNFGISNAMGNCGAVAVTNYNPGALSYSSNYQWRIDATNILGVTTGDVWTFSVMPQPPIVLIIGGTGRDKAGGTGMGNRRGYVQNY